MSLASNAYKLLCKLYRGVLSRQRVQQYLKEHWFGSTGRTKLALQPLEPRVMLSASMEWSALADGGLWSDPANWTVTSGSDADGLPDTDDTVVFNATSVKTSVIDADFAVQRLQVGAGYTGTIGLGANTLSTSSEFTVANAGSLDAGTGLVRFTGQQTVDSAAALHDLEIDTTGYIYLQDDLAVANDLTLTNVGGINGSGGTYQLQVSGDVTSNDTSFANSYASVSLVGSANQTLTGTGVLVNLDVSKAGGDVLLPSDFVLDNGRLTGSGAIKNAGGKLILGDGNGHYYADFGGSVDDLEINTGNYVIYLKADLAVTNDLTLTSVGGIVGSGGTYQLQVSGDVISNDTSFANSDASVSLVGSANQTLTGTGVLVNLDVSKAGGDVLLPSDFVLDNGRLTGSGAIKNAGGKLILGDGNGHYYADFGGSVDDLEINTGNYVIYLKADLAVTNDLTLTSVGGIVGSGGTYQLQVSGDVISNDTSFANSDASVSLVGSANQTLTGTGVLHLLDISKLGGDVLMSTFNTTFTKVTVSAGQWDVLGNTVAAAGGIIAQGGKITGAGTLDDNVTVNDGGALGGTVVINGNVTANSGGTVNAGNGVPASSRSMAI